MADVGGWLGRLDFLGRHVAAIERQFGSGAASFFQLIRYFVLTNVLGEICFGKSVFGVLYCLALCTYLAIMWDICWPKIQ